MNKYNKKNYKNSPRVKNAIEKTLKKSASMTSEELRSEMKKNRVKGGWGDVLEYGGFCDPDLWFGNEISLDVSVINNNDEFTLFKKIKSSHSYKEESLSIKYNLVLSKGNKFFSSNLPM